MKTQVLKTLITAFLKFLFVILFAGFIIYEIIFICRLYFFVSCVIPSDSMQPTLLKEDYVYVTQRIPGRRVLEYDTMNSQKIIATRKKGKRGIQHNDVLLFNSPHGEKWGIITLDISSHFIKRCIALPGDTFYIDNGIYRIENSVDSFGYYPYQLQLSNMVDSQFTKIIYNCFPHDNEFSWNIKNFGPLYVPKQGDRISIDAKTVKLYKGIIEYETGKTISIRNDSALFNNSFTNEYVFAKNYYFMVGDYLFDSSDSRYWGLLPEDHIIGKVSFIWKSKDPFTDKYRFVRFFKKVL
ncbi:MAG: signal peptidase I [Firmicutes bacterium]|nr:signal peptidase I [Bacillota bacterium]